MKKLNVLLSAYACVPGRGSEPGVGWNFALTTSKYHNVWVVTHGIFVGKFISNKISDQVFFFIIYISVFFLGVRLIWFSI